MTRLPESAPGAGVGNPRPGRPRLSPKVWWRLAFGIAVAVQLIAVYAPSGPSGPDINGLDKLVHLSIFFVPSLAALMLGIRARWALGILALHAPVSELIQHFLLPQRNGDVSDAVADLSGVLLGGLAFLVWTRRHP